MIIADKKAFGADYMKRCIEVDGHIVMKSKTEFKIGANFGGAISDLVEINEQMRVVGMSSAKEAQIQAKKIAGASLGLRDVTAPFYYRVAPNKKRITPEVEDTSKWAKLIVEGRA